MAEPERLDEKKRHFVAALLACSPELADLARLAGQFRTMVREQRAGELDKWLAAANGRMKTIKRTMCGRAGFERLRQRVLQAA